MSSHNSPQERDPARLMPAHSSGMPRVRQLLNWMFLPAICVLLVYILIDNRARSDYRIPPLDKAQVATGKLEILDFRRNKGAFKIFQEKDHIIVGCIPNMNLLNCASPEIRTKYNGKKVTVRYFKMENAKAYENIILQLEHEGQVILPYEIRISSLKQKQNMDAKFPLGFYIFAALVGLALNTIGRQTTLKQPQKADT